jgi:hypothetical protein
MTDRTRDAGLALVLSAATIGFAAYLDSFYPLQNWLFFRYAFYWLVTLLWATSCLSLGFRLIPWFSRGGLRRSEELVLGFALGVFAFCMAVFVIGLLHGLNLVTFFALPLLFFAAGAKKLAREALRIRARVRRAPPTLRLDHALCFLVGAFGVGILYFQMLWPEILSFDARWYHFPLAQRYALTGAVEPFKEGFWQQAWPHMMSYLYAWVFLAKGLILFDRVALCQHLEFLLVLATLAQIPVVVRRLVPGSRSGLSWVVLLCFPATFLYDNNLNGGADHFVGFFALPVALTLLFAFRNFRVESAALCALFIAAAALVKYTALSVVVGPLLGLGGYGLYRALRDRSRATLLAFASFVIVLLIATAAHWLKNWAFFGDPFYPVLWKYLDVHPFTPEVPSRLEVLRATANSGTLDAKGLFEALKATVTFSFVANNWWVLQRDVPVFGSLYTFSIACLPFVRGAKRLLWLYACVTVGVFSWWLLNHYERYLQGLLPWMAVASAACFTLVWRQGALARAGLVLLVSLQLVWGGDVPFFRTHNLIGDSQIRHVASFVPSGFEKRPGRLRLFEPMASIGEALPEDAVVLAHDTLTILGIDRNWVTDDHQSRISYGRLRSPAKIHAVLRELGVTHLAWRDTSIHRDTLAGDLAFLQYAVLHSVNVRRVHDYNVADLPERAPTDAAADYDVVVFGCNTPYASGFYRLSDLMLPVVAPGPAPVPRESSVDLASAKARADLLVIDACHRNLEPTPEFRLVSQRRGSRLYVRSEPRR